MLFRSRAYVPAKHPVHAYRAAIVAAAMDAGLQPTSDVLEVTIVAEFGRPKSHLNKSGVKPSAPRLPRPDVDNVAKAVLDAIGPIVGDDAQVKRLIVDKKYASEGRTMVCVASVRKSVQNKPKTRKNERFAKCGTPGTAPKAATGPSATPAGPEIGRAHV